MPHEQILRKLLEQIASEQCLNDKDINIKPISSDGANYTSKLFLATIKSDNTGDLHLFAKVAALGDKTRSELPIAVFEIERKAYTNIAKVYQELQDKNNIPDEYRLKFPKFYGCNPVINEETIVLEDLTAQGYEDHDRFKPVNWQYASKAIEELAKFHALSFAYEQEYPDEFKDLVKELTIDWQSITDEKRSLFESVVRTGVAATIEENKERVKEYISKMSNIEKIKEYFMSAGRSTLIHRDYRVSNLMHKLNDDGNMEIKIIDYQTIRGGSPVIDLFYFIFTGSDEEFRKQHYEQLLDHYYTHLSMALQRLGLDPNDIYPRDVYELDLKQKLPFSLGIAMFTLPLLTAEAKNVPKMDTDIGIKCFSVEKSSDLFVEKINGIINDFIRWKLL